MDRYIYIYMILIYYIKMYVLSVHIYIYMDGWMDR